MSNRVTTDLPSIAVDKIGAGQGSDQVGTFGQVLVSGGENGQISWQDPTSLAGSIESSDSSTTDNALVRWDGTDAGTIQNSGITVDDSDNITGVNDLSLTQIKHSSSNSILRIIGDTDSGSGGEIRLYGSSESSDANDVEIYSNNTRIYRYNASAPLTQIGDGSDLGVYIRPSFLQLNNAATSGANAGILNGVSDGVTYLGGGTAQTNSANIQLFGSSHSTKASDFEIRAGTTDIINYDHSSTELTLGASGVNVVVGNAGSTETHTFTGGLFRFRDSTNTTRVAIDPTGTPSLDWTSSNGSINSISNFYINIDSNNNGTSSEFVIAHDAEGSAGAELFKVTEAGDTIIGASGGSQTHRINGATSTSATAGSNGDVPAQVAGYLVININGTDRKIPYYAT